MADDRPCSRGFRFERTSILEHRIIAKDTWQLTFRSEALAGSTLPGQFFMVRLSDCNDPLIGRALAMFDRGLDAQGRPETISVAYVVKGKFTRALSDLHVGQSIEVWGPLGNAFSTEPVDHLVMVAGGVGITPMLCFSYNVDEFLKNGKTPEKYKDNKKKLEDDLTRIYARIFNSPYDQAQKNNIKSYGNIMFFPLKALIYAAYQFLDEEEQNDIPHLLFGNTLMKIGGKMCSINIGDLLIEVETFQKWYYDKFFKKDRLDYPFGVFIRDIMSDLVPETLYRNRSGFDDKAPTSAVKEVKYYLLDEPEERLKLNIYLNDDENELKRFSALMSRIPTANPNPLVYFGQINNQTTQVTSPLFSNLGVSEFKFNEEQDAKKGIPHIKIGADGGFFTKVNFTAQDFSKIRTALAMEALADKASKYFFFYYQLSIESMGTNMFNYDSVVCVPSNPLGIDTEENDTGIAGYYKVINITDTITKDNMYSSTSKADWVFNPKYLNREKEKAVAAPGTSIIIKDSVDVSVNSPIKYVFELLESDVDSILNAQVEDTPKQDKKDVAKKDKEKKQEPEKMSYDREEKFNQTPQPSKK